MKTRANCRRCGHEVFLVSDLGPPINLDLYRVFHVRRWRDRFHRPVIEAEDFLD